MKKLELEAENKRLRQTIYDLSQIVLKLKPHRVRRANKDEVSRDCCGDRYTNNIEFICSCGVNACWTCMRDHAFKANIVSPRAWKPNIKKPYDNR